MRGSVNDSASLYMNERPCTHLYLYSWDCLELGEKLLHQVNTLCVCECVCLSVSSAYICARARPFACPRKIQITPFPPEQIKTEQK